VFDADDMTLCTYIYLDIRIHIVHVWHWWHDFLYMYTIWYTYTYTCRNAGRHRHIGRRLALTRRRDKRCASRQRYHCPTMTNHAGRHCHVGRRLAPTRWRDRRCAFPPGFRNFRVELALWERVSFIWENVPIYSWLYYCELDGQCAHKLR